MPRSSMWAFLCSCLSWRHHMYDHSHDWLLSDFRPSFIKLHTVFTWSVGKMSVNPVFSSNAMKCFLHLFNFSNHTWIRVSSLLGTNRWLGTPKNPFSTFRICGGASSGAAVSVGSNVVDFAIGKNLLYPVPWIWILCFLLFKSVLSSTILRLKSIKRDAWFWSGYSQMLLS